MDQSRIDKAAANKLAALAAESFCSVERAAEEWNASAQRNGNYPEVCIELRPDEIGRYFVDPLEPKILEMARKEYAALFPGDSRE